MWRCGRESRVAASDPTNAASGSNSNEEAAPEPASMRSPVTIVAAAASAPPLETPNSAGSARGLRNRPCMMVPLAARSPPIMTASTMRGSRIDHSTSWSRASVAASLSLTAKPSAAGTRRTGIPAAPIVTAITVTIASSNSNATVTTMAAVLDRHHARPDGATAGKVEAIVIEGRTRSTVWLVPTAVYPCSSRNRAVRRGLARRAQCGGRNRANRARPS